MNYIGYFEVTSGKIKASDPCYDMSDTHMGFVIPALNGRWNAYLEYSESGFGGSRPGKIMIRHESYNYVADSEFKELTTNDVGVDSGQAGFWDVSYDTSIEPNYADIVELILGADAGVNAVGVYSSSGDGDGVYSSSGDGDGGYPCHIAVNNDGLMIAGYIDFYPAYEDEYEAEEDSYDNEYEKELEYAGDPD